jgi:hypothetical protein
MITITVKKIVSKICEIHVVSHTYESYVSGINDNNKDTSFVEIFARSNGVGATVLPRLTPRALPSPNESQIIIEVSSGPKYFGLTRIQSPKPVFGPGGHEKLCDTSGSGFSGLSKNQRPDWN